MPEPAPLILSSSKDERRGTDGRGEPVLLTRTRPSTSPGRSADASRADETAAGRLIAAEIARVGPIPFERFMELALYAPDVGYYAQPGAGPGPDGDYVTSPEIHPAFGGLLCAQLQEMWEALGRPSPFWLVEGGPGSGQFAADVLTVAESVFPHLANALRLALIEASAALRARQQARLAPWWDRVRWLDPGLHGDGPLGAGCVFANELLDAPPIHCVAMSVDGLRERYVAVRDEVFIEVNGALSRTEIERQIADGGGRLETGQMGEVNLAAPAWVESVLPLISRGYALLLDYGEPADLLYGARHPRGTLRCYSRQAMNEEPFCRVGRQDMTSHVDLSAVVRAAHAAGGELLAATSQESLLGRLGLPYLVATAHDSAKDRAGEWAHESALRALADPRGLGRITALLFGQGAPLGSFTGFTRSEASEELAHAVAPTVFGLPPRLGGGAIQPR